jgi:hypothetical protein
MPQRERSQPIGILYGSQAPGAGMVNSPRLIASDPQ